MMSQPHSLIDLTPNEKCEPPNEDRVIQVDVGDQ